MEEHQLAGHAWYTAVEAAGLAGLVPLLHFDAHSDLSTPFGGSAEVGLGNLTYRNLWATRNDAFIIRVEAFVRGFVSELIWVVLSVVPSEGAMEIGTLLYDGEVMAPQTDTSSGKPEPVWCYPGRLHVCECGTFAVWTFTIPICVIWGHTFTIWARPKNVIWGYSVRRA